LYARSGEDQAAGCLDRDAKSAQVKDLDVRTLRAYSSQLSRRMIRNGRHGGKRPISAATKNRPRAAS